jgi:polyhydroxyalkanoate synthase subunit PhaC
VFIPVMAPRQGPRPLPLHLASAATLWMSSRAALPLLKDGLLPWRPELRPAANALRQSLEPVAAEHFAAAVDRELRARGEGFLNGLERYRHHPYRRALADPPVLWQEGSTRVLDYGPGDGRPLLVVPSLINRAYILDLAAGKSLLRFLSGHGLRPLLVDWGKPGRLERGFDLTAYVAGRLEAAAAAVAAVAGAPLAVLGYCMGGLLALGLAERKPGLVAALGLLATPWDFHAERAGQARVLGEMAEPLTRGFTALGELPVDLLQALFAALDPLLAVRKFSRFATLAPGSAQERDFVALEDWLNDGVPLALPVARECLGGWYGANAPGRGEWRIAGRPVLPQRVRCPSLVVLPAQDRIVPPRTAVALAERLPAAERLSPPLGHIGMVVAREAPAAVWAPLAAWLKRTAVPARRRAPARRSTSRRSTSR